MLELWENVSSSFIDVQDDGEKYLSEIFTNIINDSAQFSRFIEKVLEGALYQFHEGYFVHLPLSLLDDDEYHGAVEISWNNFDDQEHIGLVRLDKFCFFVKLAAVFHSKHVDPDFNPWDDFQKLDEMQRKYYPYPNT